MNDSSSAPLTTLKEEEQLFRESVASFAREQIGPHVSEMDEQASFRAGSDRGFFRFGFDGDGDSRATRRLRLQLFHVHIGR